MVVWTVSGKSRRPFQEPAERLHAAAVAQSRASKLYAEMGAPDSVEGRFELLTLHVILLVERLKAEGEEGAGLRQALFDTYVSQLDGAMREMGVGDLAMGKRMRKLGEAFYGRASGYSVAFAALPDLTELKSILTRTVLDGVDVESSPLADYVARAYAHLALAPTDRLLVGEPSWASP
jgi:cytochrome b pre-mRNA-processing protein 3